MPHMICARASINADTGASLFHSQHIGLPGGSPICCDVLIVPCMRTADRLRPIFQTGTAGIRSPLLSSLRKAQSAGPHC